MSRRTRRGLKRGVSGALPLLLFALGAGLLLYPTLSDCWNSYHQSRAIIGYAEQAAGLDAATRAQMLADAAAYNRELPANSPGRALNEDEQAAYQSRLDVTGTGVMGYVEVPQINCTLPIYHGTDEAVLQIGMGHLAWSSLPVGGPGTHTVLSGHRGLPSARLLTDLDRLEPGDVFYLHVLGETLAYQVDQILTVEPEDIAALGIDPQADFCTLVTCTPYGINSHRLLVRGRRIAAPEGADGALMQELDAPEVMARRQLLRALLPVGILAGVIGGYAVWRQKRRGAGGAPPGRRDDTDEEK